MDLMKIGLFLSFYCRFLSNFYNLSRYAVLWALVMGGISSMPRFPTVFVGSKGKLKKGLIKTVSKLYYYLPSYLRTVMEQCSRGLKR